MAHRIALSVSVNGKAVYLHFGRTDTFHIFSLDDAGYAFVEARTVEPCCYGGEHETSAFDNVLNKLSDCEAVVVGKIGPSASDYLADKGMRVFVTEGYVEDVMQEFHRNLVKYFSPESDV